jgi:hypothetical protein
LDIGCGVDAARSAAPHATHAVAGSPLPVWTGNPVRCARSTVGWRSCWTLAAVRTSKRHARPLAPRISTTARAVAGGARIYTGLAHPTLLAVHRGLCRAGATIVDRVAGAPHSVGAAGGRTRAGCTGVLAPSSTRSSGSSVAATVSGASRRTARRRRARGIATAMKSCETGHEHCAEPSPSLFHDDLQSEREWWTPRAPLGYSARSTLRGEEQA